MTSDIHKERFVHIISTYTDRIDFRKLSLDVVDIDIVLRCKDYWVYENWYQICKSENIYCKDIADNSSLPWGSSLLGLSMNTNTNLQDVLKYSYIPWNWKYLSKHPNMTIDDRLRYPDLPWNDSEFSKNINITLDDVLMNPHIILDWDEISKHHNISVIDRLNNPDLPWNDIEFTKNPNITINDTLYPNIQIYWKNVSKYHNIPLGWSDIAEYGKISIHDIKTIPELQREKMIYHNKNISQYDIIINPEIPWDYSSKYIIDGYYDLKNCLNYPDVHMYKRSHDITDITYVLENPHYGWYYDILSRNIPYDDIIKNAHLPWNWEVIVNYNID